ncbi:hypothetical protein WR25_08974 [Diploscapter pachys]|uniref:Uncharacterized protein n=1 Tax=Diploscapter pachys TaxID=2018661 RepID=A0A2A2LSY2_9BILA|nr:hypothetical protein WR25_08974 [Diploscapter pachys]
MLRREYPNKGVTIQSISPALVCSNLSKKKRPSFFIPDADTFARSAIATIGLTEKTSGYIGHQIQTDMAKLVPSVLGDFFLDRKVWEIRRAALRRKAREAKGK